MSWLTWENAGLIEIGIVFGIVLVFAAWDLAKTKREIRADKARLERADEG
jgi:hypothetical protein